MAINGKTGKVLWRFNKKQGGIKWFNFYNPLFISDQDHDGIDEYTDVQRRQCLGSAFFEEKDRRPGNLVVLSGKNGKTPGQGTHARPVKRPTCRL